MTDCCDRTPPEPRQEPQKRPGLYVCAECGGKRLVEVSGPPVETVIGPVCPLCVKRLEVK